jgi:hypothetical protein
MGRGGTPRRFRGFWIAFCITLGARVILGDWPASFAGWRGDLCGNLGALGNSLSIAVSVFSIIPFAG